MNTRTAPRSSDSYIESLLALEIWDGLTITFSFPTLAQYSDYDPASEPLASYSAFNAAQKDAVRHILSTISAFTNLTFVEVTGAQAGTATLRFANTEATDTAFAFLPDSSSIGGDSWYGAWSYMLSPVVGTYSYMTILHEIGHSLGLLHPHEPLSGPPMPADRDWMAYTVMSYRSAPNDVEGYYNTESNFAQTFMLQDIATLQHAYGANYTTNSGDTTYSFDPTTGEYFIDGVGQGTPAENVMLVTIWDGGGTDTYDFSSYTQPGTIDLRPGNWTEFYPIQLADLGSGNRPPGAVANAYLFNGDTRSLIENAIGGTGNDEIYGNQADNRLEGRTGRDKLWGYEGNDHLLGGAEGDDLYGGTGNDELDGGSGDDYLLGEEGDDTIFGGGGSDSILGGVGIDRLYGQDGDDYISGGADNDRLVGAAGQDRLFGDDGNDLLQGGDDDDELSGGSGNDRLEGGSGNDLLDGGTGVDEMIGGLGDDEYVWDNIGDYIVENPGEGIDTLSSAVFNLTLPANFENLTLLGVLNLNATGDAANNTLTGNSGNNILDGRGGVDVYSGGYGDDTYYIDHADELIYDAPGLGTDTVYSSVSFTLTPGYWTGGGASVRRFVHRAEIEYFYLTGTADIDGTGNERDDNIIGNSGNNVLTGMEGDDQLDGGAGLDTARFSGLFADYTITEIAAGVFEVSGADGTDTLRRIEFAQFDDQTVSLVATPNVINGTAGPDILTGTANIDEIFGLAGDDVLFGYDGEDTLDGGGDNDTLNAGDGNDILIGGDGNDVLKGGAGDDDLRGGNGRDVLRGETGDDMMAGGADNDVYYVDSVGDSVTELAGEGYDQVRSEISYVLGANVEKLKLVGVAASTGTGNALDNYIEASPVASTLTGLAGNDFLFGNRYNDYLSGDAGDDSLSGKDGDDRLIGGDGEDKLYGGNDADRLYGQDDNDKLLGGNGDDILVGGDGFDYLRGQGDNDWLLGGNGNDRLKGEAGNDILEGGKGRDIMVGGTGQDTYVFDDGDFAGLGPGSADIISDFTRAEGDIIDLSAVDADTSDGADDAFTFIGNAAFSGTAGELRWEHNGSSTMLYMDVDGDMSADYAIRLLGNLNLASADFVL